MTAMITASPKARVRRAVASQATASTVVSTATRAQQHPGMLGGHRRSEIAARQSRTRVKAIAARAGPAQAARQNRARCKRRRRHSAAQQVDRGERAAHAGASELEGDPHASTDRIARALEPRAAAARHALRVVHASPFPRARD